MAVPPPGAVAAGFLSYDQLRRSWYMFFFQSPLADAVVGMDDLSFIDRLWADWSPGLLAGRRRPAGGEGRAPRPREPAAALGYYRATFNPTRQSPELAAEEAAVLATPPQPHLYLHGSDDGCMAAELARGAGVFLPVPGSRAEIIDGTGHFLHLEDPDSVNRLIVDFVAT